MSVFYLIVAVVSSSLMSILSSLFIRKNEVHKNSGVLFNFLLAIVLLIVWGIYYAIEGGFNPGVLIYSAIFAVSFMGAFIFLHCALASGPLSFTTLLMQMSLVFTAIWGLIFWGSSLTVLTISGLVLISISLALCIIKKEPGKKFNFKWLIFSVLTCVANASCSIVVKTEQIQFENQFGGQMMFFAFVFACIMAGVFYLCCRKNVQVSNIKGTWWIAALCGLFNFILNLFVILLAGTTMSPSIIYPTIAVGALFLNVLYSLIFNKEKLTVIQIIGLVIGAVSIALLSI